MCLPLMGISTQMHFHYRRLPIEPWISITFLVFDTAALVGRIAYQNLFGMVHILQFVKCF